MTHDRFEIALTALIGLAVVIAALAMGVPWQ